MCYSAEVSIGTFLFVAAGVAYMWNRNGPLDRPFSALLLVVALMQLVEFFLWRNLSCGPANQFWTQMIPFALMLQPLLSLFIMWQFKAGWGPYYKELFFAVLLLFIPPFVNSWNKVKGCTTLDGNGHLIWPTETTTLSPVAYWVYWLGIGYCYATLNDTTLATFMILFHFLSYKSMEFLYPKSWPSMWCHFVNILVVLGIARPVLMR